MRGFWDEAEPHLEDWGGKPTMSTWYSFTFKLISSLYVKRMPISYYKGRCRTAHLPYKILSSYRSRHP